MIIIKVKDGLGNQLFQYALGRYFVLIKNREVLYDLNWYKGDSIETNREFILPIFNTIIEIADEKLVEEIKTFSSSFFVKFYKRFLRLRPFHRAYLVREQLSIFLNRNIFKLSTAYLEGYWQDEKHLTEIRPILLNEISLKENYFSKEYRELLKQIESSNSVAIHIRKGDYNNDFYKGIYYVLGIHYYKAAIKKILSLEKDLKFFVFTNDHEWVLNSFVDVEVDFEFVNKSGELEDFHEFSLMTKCNHFIIANSTFSWWASWLSEHQDKKVFAPDTWFNNDILQANYEKGALAQFNWIKVTS